ncbi:malate synthase G [Aurantiacibacter aquimixticola]|uniref:Malate synthase G n=1 Tax=Aurantiacibacter aquimixticola TaxID=1958945 RepID=A0A419RRB6_9SPHN|nr:malate synthase G [Aurantiacibacter aquimixticola]RJY08330.1 malate synthase G [Aurantiacibacter aquimixticola]
MNRSALAERESHVDRRADYLPRAGLQVAPELAAFVENEVLANAGLEADAFWQGFAEISRRFGPRNRALLQKRAELQDSIDGWHRANPGARRGAPEGFLREIGYLVPEPAPLTIGTQNVDPEIASIAGPQLVVPVLNARFLLNAINARWGSLYDALYGTDALDGTKPPAGEYDAQRGASVIARAKAFLDEAAPLAGGPWADWTGGLPTLANPAQLTGTIGDNLLLANNGLHIEIVIDPQHPIGMTDPAGIADIRLEAALSTIVDLEDSVAAIDAEDKVAAYRNWLGAIRGDLEARFEKNGDVIVRQSNEDRSYTDMQGDTDELRARSLLLVRNVGHLMTTPAVLTENGDELHEGLLDAAITVAVAMQDRGRNSRHGSIYIVKPKMHGPDECAFANELFDAVEDMLGLARHTIKIGVMDEERRTSANLTACIHAVKDRVFFINTGFLDRTGDEIHTSMLAGPMMRKGGIKQAEWIAAYEDRNVQIGLACGFQGRAQIGKGMWAAPDRMRAMLAEKAGHPASGASTAWVPSPTAAVLHAMHYHQIDVAERQRERSAETLVPLGKLLSVPLSEAADWSADDIAEELRNNVQGILGYMVRWIDQGIGCSKVPDIHDIGLMEDRATLRISSQHIANWLLHGVVDRLSIDAALHEMAAKVDAQNAGDPTYHPMMADPRGSIALAAARELIVGGTEQPSGYTEPVLHRARMRAKAML